MRYRLTRSSKEKRAQVMTPPALARFVVDLLSGERESWLELGSGTGNLARACLESRNPASYLGVEVDSRLVQSSPLDTRASFQQGDALRPGDLASLLGERMFSRIVGNPPYGMQALSLEAQKRLAELCPGVPQIFDWVQLDLYFMLESLARLHRPGEAAFIVGAPIAEDARLVAFRRALMCAASEVECFELPVDAFDRRAEVRSFVLVARFGTAKLQRVRLGKLARDDLDIVAESWVTPEEAVQRLDFAYHEFQAINTALRGTAGTATLSDLGASVIRGSRTRAQFDQLGIECFHTSDFPPQGLEVQFSVDHDHGFQVAAISDILLPRVGTRCLGRQAIVTRGQRHYTEAVYRLRVPRKHHSRVVDWVLSEAGIRWRQAAATGSCAKHITVATLMQMPVPVRT